MSKLHNLKITEPFDVNFQRFIYSQTEANLMLFGKSYSREFFSGQFGIKFFKEFCTVMKKRLDLECFETQFFQNFFSQDFPKVFKYRKTLKYLNIRS